jgi:hypothetical protein
MEQGFIDILKKVVTQHGKEYFLETKRCKAIVSDRLPNSPGVVMRHNILHVVVFNGSGLELSEWFKLPSLFAVICPPQRRVYADKLWDKFCISESRNASDTSSSVNPQSIDNI